MISTMPFRTLSDIIEYRQGYLSKGVPMAAIPPVILGAEFNETVDAIAEHIKPDPRLGPGSTQMENWNLEKVSTKLQGKFRMCGIDFLRQEEIL
jgi:hypothetical protein